MKKEEEDKREKEEEEQRAPRERERQAEVVDAGRKGEVSVNYCLQFGISECGPGQ